MWTILKGCFWFSLVLIALPLFDAESTQRLEAGPNFETAGSISAAMSLYSDVTSICQREPDVCAVANQTVGVLGARAKEGARIAYQFLDNQFGADAQAEQSDMVADQITTSAIITNNPEQSALPTSAN